MAHLVDSDGATVDGGWQDGDPDTGTQPTQLAAKWHNMVQEELQAVVEGAGLALDDMNNAQLLAAIDAKIAAATASSRVPVGAVQYLAGNAAAVPVGWLICDGSAISRTTYADLWAYAQTSGILAADGADKTANPGKFGLGDGATTFELPLIEDFISGLKAGRSAGSWELDQMQRIQGVIGRVLSNAANSPPGTFEASGPFSTSATAGQYSAAGENVALVSMDTGSAASGLAGLRAGTYTRPRNTCFPAMIKD